LGEINKATIKRYLYLHIPGGRQKKKKEDCQFAV